jgi:hypothetical protein
MHSGHKFAIRKMLELLKESQDNFEEIVSSRLSIDSPAELISDSVVSDSLRLIIEKSIQKFYSDIRSSGCDQNLSALRMSQLEIMMFGMGDAIISQAKENAANDVKYRAFEQIDDILCTQMRDGMFSDPESARQLLQSFQTVYNLTKQVLEELPFLQRTHIEKAHDELGDFLSPNYLFLRNH